MQGQPDAVKHVRPTASVDRHRTGQPATARSTTTGVASDRPAVDAARTERFAPSSVAILSDVHGNDVALRAVLADVATVPHDALIHAGDYVFNGPRPGEALAHVRATGAPMLLGNTDEYLWQPVHHATMPLIVAWTRQRIGDDDVALLRSLPLSHRITPPGGRSPDDDLLIVHATPTDVDAELVLALDPFGTHTVTGDDEAARLIGDTRAGLIVYGHLHFASSGTVNGQRLTSVGSVGMSLDGNPDAAWAVAQWDGATWTLAHRRTPYNVASVADELERVHPVPAIGRVLAERLRQARWLPFPETSDKPDTS